MSLLGGSPDKDAMSDKGRWVDATRRASKKSVSAKDRLRMELG